MSFSNPANPRYPETNGFHLFRWENTAYNFKTPIVVPKWTLPNCFSHCNSLVIDRKGAIDELNEVPLEAVERVVHGFHM